MTDNMEMVYICAPLRGDVQKNIEFARQRAQEVFQQGKIPICPHLMFPPIADPNHPGQDESAREMGLKLLEKCTQINVYGRVLTDGMREEIRHAKKCGILVFNKQEKQKATENKKKKGRKAYER